jgi:hypothetical protein
MQQRVNRSAYLSVHTLSCKPAVAAYLSVHYAMVSRALARGDLKLST